MKMSKTKLSKRLRKMGYRFSELVFPLGSSSPIFYIVRYYNKKIIACDYFKFYDVFAYDYCGFSIKDYGFDEIDYQEYLRLYNILGKF